MGRPLGKWLCLTLGVWHPFKQASSVIWKTWGQRILGPYFNHVCPDANFFETAKLGTVTTYLSYIRLAYPLFKKELKLAITETQTNQINQVPVSNLRDLRDLCEFFIPTVSFININDLVFYMYLMQFAGT